MAGQTILAKKAVSERNRKWDDYAIAFLQVLHSGTRLFDHPHELMPEDHVVLLWDESIVNVQIRAADRGRGHPQDNVLRIFDPGIVHIVDFYFTGVMENQRFHYFFALPGFAILPCCFASIPDGVTAANAD